MTSSQHPQLEPSPAHERWSDVEGDFLITDAEQMEALGARLARVLDAGDLVILSGDLGAGKTTLTRGLGAALGVRGQVTSPTFVLARTHPRPAGGVPLVHVDAYRLGSAAELDDLDIDFGSSIVVVEWGDDMVEGNATEWLHVRIDTADSDPDARQVVIERRTSRVAK